MDVRVYKNVNILVALVWVTTVTRGLQELDWRKLQVRTFAGEGLCILNPDACRNVTELITSKGYPCEDHTVKTKDGYLLAIQRIPHGKASGRQNRPVVFLQHGLLASSTDWVMNLANESLGYLLADAGFDVWLGNSRGNTYSRKHATLSPNSNAFWAFSWDEMAEYDLPAVLEYILNHTGQQDLYYIGHSQGTLIAFSAFSRNQQLAKKVKLFVALGPVTRLDHIKSPIKYLSYFSDEILYVILGRRDFLPNNWMVKLLDYSVCVTKVTKFVCDDIIFLLAGFDIHNLNQTRLPVYIAHTPAGASMQDMVHFAQMVRDKNYEMYDYGTAALNKAHYGQVNPPAYNVTNMKTPVVLFYAEKDWLATPEVFYLPSFYKASLLCMKTHYNKGDSIPNSEIIITEVFSHEVGKYGNSFKAKQPSLITEFDNRDVKILIPQLQDVRGSHLIMNWNHLDFVWAYNAKNVIYDKIIKMLKDDISQTGF